MRMWRVCWTLILCSTWEVNLWLWPGILLSVGRLWSFRVMILKRLLWRTQLLLNWTELTWLWLCVHLMMLRDRLGCMPLILSSSVRLERWLLLLVRILLLLRLLRMKMKKLKNRGRMLMMNRYWRSQTLLIVLMIRWRLIWTLSIRLVKRMKMNRLKKMKWLKNWKIRTIVYRSSW
jgi:hypothetical protein